MKIKVTIGLFVIAAASIIFAKTQYSLLTTDLLTANAVPPQTEGFSTPVYALGGYTGTGTLNDVFSTRDMQSWNLISAHNAQSTTKWSPRMNPNIVYAGNVYWLIGTGYWNSPSNNVNSPHDVWGSRDGVRWRLMTSNPPFNNYYGPFTTDFANYYEYHAAAIGSRLYVVGGKPGNNNKAVVWTSTDGINWTQLTEAAPFETRVGFSLVSFNNKLYVIGGRYAMNSYGNSGIWSSSDGTNWTLVTANPAFGKYLSFSKALVYNNKLWILGGVVQTIDAGINTPNIWNSTDGVTWSLVSNTLPGDSEYTNFALRDAVVAGGKIWTGNALTPTSNVSKLWSSTDGVTWTQSPTTPAWSGRSGYKFITR